MASALYDEGHPLYEYFQASGDDGTRTIPGGLDKVADLTDEERARDLSVTSLMTSAISNSKLMFLAAPPIDSKVFAERFKYIIISSPLLSSSVAPIPLDAPDPVPREDRRRATRVALAPAPRPFSIRRLVVPMPSADWLIPFIGVVAVASRRTNIVVTITACILRAFFTPAANAKADAPNPFGSPFNAMNDLISASEVWDTLVGKALGALELEESQPITTPASEQLRTTLIEAFDTMHAESDSVRQLFSPLASPLELSMLSEMYAPDAPSVSPAPSSHVRGSSAYGFSSPSPHSSIFAKRSTWNGAGRARQPHEVHELEDEHHSHSPPSPSVASFTSEMHDDTFGASALGIARHRRKVASVKRDFASPFDRPGSPLKQSTRPSSTQFTHSSSPLTSPMKYDAGRTSPRRPRSLSSLKISLERAIMSRRYAASHLLALRFEEDPLDPYWEDVASVMNLFSRSILDVSSSLAEALNEYLAARMAEQIPTPPPSKVRHLAADERGLGIHDVFSMPLSPLPSPLSEVRRLPSVELSSFAPMPTDLAQFAAHMDVMSKSILTAQKELRTCLNALQSPPGSPEDAENVPNGDDKDSLTQKVMDAYARLRRELGTALKECERGRAPLAATLNLEPQDKDGDEMDDSRNDNSPGGVAPLSPALSHSSLAPAAELETGVDSNASMQLDLDVFDEFINAKRLENEAALSTSSPSGGKNPFAQPDPEQVYEAIIPPATMQLREKSKLSRAERIRQMRERRAAGGATVLSDIPGSSSDERGSEKNGKGGRTQMGPGGDVVQELRSVINLVSERRRGSQGASGNTAGTSGSSTLATPSPLSQFQSVSGGTSPVMLEAQLPSTLAIPSTSSSASSSRDEQENEPPVRGRTISTRSQSSKSVAAISPARSAQGSEPLTRIRTTSTGTARASKPTRPPPPPPPPMDGFETDTFGHGDSQSLSSPSLPSSPSPPSSPLALSFDVSPSSPTTPYKSALNSPMLPPGTPPTPSPRSSHSSLPSRVSTLLSTTPSRPSRPARPNRQLPSVPPADGGNAVTVS